MLCRFTGTKKYRRRIFLITDGEKQSKVHKSELDQIIKTIKENDIKLNCITIDFCNELAEEDDSEEEQENRPKPSEESPEQEKNKELLMKLKDQTGCAIIPVETAIELYQ